MTRAGLPNTSAREEWHKKHGQSQFPRFADTAQLKLITAMTFDLKTLSKNMCVTSHSARGGFQEGARLNNIFWTREHGAQRFFCLKNWETCCVEVTVLQVVPLFLLAQREKFTSPDIGAADVVNRLSVHHW